MGAAKPRFTTIRIFVPTALVDEINNFDKAAVVKQAREFKL